MKCHAHCKALFFFILFPVVLVFMLMIPISGDANSIGEIVVNDGHVEISQNDFRTNATSEMDVWNTIFNFAAAAAAVFAAVTVPRYVIIKYRNRKRQV